MMAGTVTDTREIIIRLEVLTNEQSIVPLEAVVDTGFNGFLTLPATVLNTLGASSAGMHRAEMGDGRIVELDVFLVTVKWLDELREVLALQTDCIPLIGMSLLWGSRVTFDAQAGGAVLIDTIP